MYMYRVYKQLLQPHPLVVINEGDGLASVVYESALRVLVPCNIINPICSVIVSGEDNRSH